MKIIITEKQLHKIVENKLLMKEYMDSSFDWDKFNYLLDNIGITAAEEYCYKKLGKPLGEGSSRIVFEIDDHTVLKLSLSKDDIEQNLHEYNVYKELKGNPLLPKIYAHSDDYVWLWCEKVLPCHARDFEKILGIPYSQGSYFDYKVLKDKDKEEGIGYDEYENPSSLKIVAKDDDDNDKVLTFMDFIEWWSDYNADYEYEYSDDIKETFRQWLRHPWFQNLIELFEHQSLDEFFDKNMGIAIRDGKPTIVVLDVGWL